tara:strand:- start:514 stop:684 length:171 start_codon:yes stop_codon:yes gene_type:complete
MPKPKKKTVTLSDGTIIKYTLTKKGRQVFIPKKHSARADQLYLEADLLINEQESRQ